MTMVSCCFVTGSFISSGWSTLDHQSCKRIRVRHTPTLTKRLTSHWTRFHSSNRFRGAESTESRYPMATIATDEISEVITKTLNLGNVTSVTRSGSSGWAVMHRVTTDSGLRLFVKVSREPVGMFEGEANGLMAMYETNTIRVPKVYHYGTLTGTSGSYIIMETLDIYAMYEMGDLGKHLALMHLAEPKAPEARNGQFGFAIDNTIGGTIQPNGWMDNWIEFFRERRLRHQCLLTGDSNLIEKGNRLCARLDELFVDVKHSLRPSLLHGDFWSGNVSGTESSPVVFDPACYYGHHEAEFGMIWCMQLNKSFWHEYRKLIPESEGFRRRNNLYQLYHYLNHYNLFGGGYYGMADHLLNDLLNSLKSQD